MDKIYDIDIIICIYNYIPYIDRLKLAHTNKYLYDIFWLYLDKTIIIDNNNSYFYNIFKKGITINKLIINSKYFDSSILSFLKDINKLKYVKIVNLSRIIINFELFPKTIEHIELGNDKNEDYYYIICPEYLYANKNKNKIIDSIKNILPNIKILKLYGNMYDYVNLLKIII